MTRSDILRRAVSLTLAVLCLLLVPQLAFAKFTDSKAPAMQVSAAKLVTPTAVWGTYTCRTGYRSEGIDIAIIGFTATGQPDEVSYVYSVYRGTSLRTTKTTSSKLVSLSTGLSSADSGNTSYRVTIVAKVADWVSPAYSKTVSCGNNLPDEGWL
jgi:hypothetical protein